MMMVVGNKEVCELFRTQTYFLYVCFYLYDQTEANILWFG